MFKMTLIWQIIDFLFSKNTPFARIKEISQIKLNTHKAKIGENLIVYSSFTIKFLSK
jgi:hypothetical protein